jgi:hypothetical protein
MKATIDLDETRWQFLQDYPDRRIERAAEQALQRIGWQEPIRGARLAILRGAGPVNAECSEMWCVKLTTEPEIRHCLSRRDADPQSAMVDKFAASFEALRAGDL